MELGHAEHQGKFHAAINRAREKMWHKIEHDSLAQKVKGEWVAMAHAVAAKLDAPSMVKVRMSIEKNLEDIGKSVAVSGHVLNIATTVAFSGTSIGLGLSTQFLTRREKALLESAAIKNVLAVEAQIRESRKKPRAIARFLGGASIATALARPVMYEAYYAAKWGKPLAERVAGIVNAIALKRQVKREAKQIYFGQGKAG